MQSLAWSHVLTDLSTGSYTQNDDEDLYIDDDGYVSSGDGEIMISAGKDNIATGKEESGRGEEAIEGRQLEEVMLTPNSLRSLGKISLFQLCPLVAFC